MYADSAHKKQFKCMGITSVVYKPKCHASVRGSVKLKRIVCERIWLLKMTNSAVEYCCCNVS